MTKTHLDSLGRWTSSATIVAVVVTLVGACGWTDPVTSSGDQQAPEACESASSAIGTDGFSLNASGTFSVFAVLGAAWSDERRRTAPVDVLSADGSVIATTSAQELDTPGTVDLRTAVQFGVYPPPVFDVVGDAVIQISDVDVPYVLVVVRHGSDDHADLGQVVLPSVEPLGMVRGCRIVSRRIDLGAAYSDTTQRQIFLVAEPANGELLDAVAALASGPSQERSRSCSPVELTTSRALTGLPGDEADGVRSPSALDPSEEIVDVLAPKRCLRNDGGATTAGQL